MCSHLVKFVSCVGDVVRVQARVYAAREIFRKLQNEILPVLDIDLMSPSSRRERTYVGSTATNDRENLVYWQ